MPDGMGLTLEIRDNSEKAIQGLNGLAASLEKIKSAVNGGFKLTGVAKQIEKLTSTLTTAVPEESIKRFEGLANVLERLKNIGPIKIKVSSGAQKLLEMQSIANEAGGGFGSMEGKMTHVEQEISGSAGNVIERLKSMGASIKKSAQELLNVRPAAKSFKSAIGGLFGPIANLGSAFLRIAKYRLLRTVIKEITEGFKTGIENLLEYSRAIGSSFATDMDSATNALLKMKNSIGAAVAPALQALIPILQTIVSWVITAANAINQFLSLLTGKSHWTRAKDVTAAAAKKVGGVGKAAKEASDEIKGLLADFDELNIIQQENSRKPSNGSGGGAGGIDYSDMFEEVSKFDSKIRQVVLWLKKHWEEILEITKLIGAAILAWKLSSAFGGVIGQLLGLATTGLIIAVVWKMTTLFDSEYLKTGGIGWLVGDVLTSAVGSYLAGKVLQKVLGTGYGYVGAGITLLFSAAASITALIKDTNVSALSKESVILSLLAAIKGGVGAWLLGSGVFNITGASGVMLGVGATGIVFGAAIGIKAIAQAVKSGVTSETVKAAALSSLAIGGGAAFAAKAVLGAKVGALGLLGIGAGAALATGLIIAATIGVATYLNTTRDNIHWGNYDATKEQIEAFVSKEMFSVDVKATMNLVDSVVSASDEEKQSLKLQVEEMIPTIEQLKFNVNTEENLEKLKMQVFGENGDGGLMGQFKRVAKTQQAVIATGITLVPLTNENGEDVSADFVKEGTEGWNLLSKAMDDFAARMNEHLGKAMNDKFSQEVRQFEANAATELAEAMTRISNAVATGESSAKYKFDYEFGLKNLSKGSFKEAVALYNEYSKNIEDAYRKSTSETAASFMSLSAGFAEAALSAADEKTRKMYEANAKKYYGLYKEYYDLALNGVENATKEAKAEGQALLRSALEEMASEAIAKAKVPINARGTFMTEAYIAGKGYKAGIAALISQITSIPKEALSALDDTGWGFLSDEIQDKIVEVLAEAYGSETTKRILDAAGAEYTREIVDTIKESTQDATDEVNPVQAYIEYDPIIDDSESSVEVETDVSSPTGNPFAESIKMLEGNVDLYNRKLIEAKKLIEAGWEDVGDADQYATLFSQTYSAGDLSQGYDWKMDKNVGIVATPILPDGRVLSPQQLETYLDSIVSRSTNAQELKTNDTLGLIVGLGEISGDLDEAYRAIDEWAEKIHEEQTEIYDTKAQEEFVKRAEQTANIDAGAIQAMYKNVAKQIDESADLGEDFWAGVNASIVEGMKAFGLDEGTAQQIADDFKFDLDQAIIAGEWDTTAASALEILKQAIENNIPDELKAPNTEAFNNAMTSAANTTVSAAQTAINAIQQWMAAASALGSMSGFSAPVPRMSGIAMAAEGGIMTTGQMFIAREAGPEYVGTMNGRTAVANNDQIVSGVASGVAAGQAEQNALLRQQNDYLRQLLAKEGTVKVVPSSEWGRFNQRSSEMYARQTGG